MLLQSEFDVLIGIKKEFLSEDILETGPHPINWSRELVSTDSHEKFLIDFNRNSIEFKKFSVNHRYRMSTVLLRYCSNGIHTNPDFETIKGPHVHIYRENYDDKFAFKPSEIGLDEIDTIDVILRKVLKYINVINPPIIQSDMLT